MHWIVASLVSALFLGVYELCTKHAVQNNAVVPVLFFSTLSGAAVWLVLLVGQTVHPGTLPASLVVDPLTLVQHLQLVLKSAIVAASWVFTYFALKHLPLSLGSPIRATSPLWTLVGALVIGSIPGGLIGSHLSTRVPVPWLRRILCTVLVATGARMLWA